MVAFGWVVAVSLLGACGHPSGRLRGRTDRALRPDPAEFREVTTGQFHSCAIDMEGRVACWGLNAQGQVGDGTQVNRASPVWARVERALDVDAGVWQTCAVLEGGAAKCWGSGHEHMAQDRALDLEGLNAIVRWVAVGDTACAIMLRGEVLCWGADQNAQPIGGTDPYLLPLHRPATYLDVGMDMLCVLKAADDVSCFHTRRGAYGYEFLPFDPPVQVENVRQLAVSGNHACGTGFGPMVCWGDNRFGQVGDDPREWVDQPIYIDAGFDVMHVTVGWRHSCAVSTAGEVYCWGDNSHGQLGDGTRRGSRRPKRVEGLGSVIVRAAAGRDHTCAVTFNRRLLCWGRNDFGQLGVGDTSDRLVASRVRPILPPRRPRR